MLDFSDSLDNVERVRTPTPSQNLPPPAKRPREDFQSLSTIHKRIPQGEFQSVTLNDGARFYLSLRAKERKEAGTSDSARASRGPTGLCGTAYASLRDQAILELSKMQSPAGGSRTELDVEDTTAMEQGPDLI